VEHNNREEPHPFQFGQTYQSLPSLTRLYLGCLDKVEKPKTDVGSHKPPTIINITEQEFPKEPKNLGLKAALSTNEYLGGIAPGSNI